MTTIASIWAQDKNGVLGTGTSMVWHVPADFAHFKASTLGCPIIMGRRSFEALGAPLPGRTNIVITRSHLYEADGIDLVYSIEAALKHAQDKAEADDAPYVWITGGAHLYAQTMDLVDELVVTDLDLDIEASNPDTPLVHAPAIDPTVWAVDPQRSDSEWNEKSGDARWKITTYVRR